MHAIDRNSVSPQVGIVMDHKTPGPIEALGNPAAVFPRIIKKVEERLMEAA